MSEHLQHKSPEKSVESSGDKVETKVEKVSYSAEQQAENVKKAEALVSAVEASSKQAERPALPIDDKPADNQPFIIDKMAKVLRRKQSLKRIQSKLPASERALSKVVHQPAVRAISEVSAKTITRPSGLFGGGIMAFVGSLTYLYLAKHIGFTYNYLLFTMFFVGGFLIGLLFELLAYAAHRSAGSKS